MRVLLTESAPGVADESERRLRAAGFDVSYCRPDHGTDHGCVVLRGIGHCPLRTDDIAMVIDIRAPDAPSTGTAREYGVNCAARLGVPLIVAGPVSSTGFPWRHAATVCDVDDLVGECQRLAEPVDEAVHRDVERLTLEVFAAAGIEPDVDVSIVHAAGSTAVFVRIPAAAEAVARAEAVHTIRRTLRGRKEFSEDVAVVLIPRS